MKNVVLFCSVLFSLSCALWKKRSTTHGGDHSRSSRSTLLRSIQCLARFLVTANGYSARTLVSLRSLYTKLGLSVRLCLLFVFCISIWVCSLFSRLQPKARPCLGPGPALIIYYYCAFKKLSYLCQAFVFVWGKMFTQGPRRHWPWVKKNEQRTLINYARQNTLTSNFRQRIYKLGC